MDRVLLSIGPINIYWYSFLIFISLIIGLIIIKLECKKKNLEFNFILDLVCYLVPIAIIGARLYYVIFKFDSFKYNLLSIFYIWEGGLAIYGAIISSIIFIIYYCKKHKKDILTILDLSAPSLILGQAIGRWGNFFNQEAYGGITSLEFLESIHIPKFIINNMYIDNAYRQPTFLYESIWCILGFIILMILRKYTKKKGTITSIYLLFYGIGRFMIESLRSDSLYIGMFRISQIVSIIIIVLGLILLIRKSENDERV